MNLPLLSSLMTLQKKQIAKEKMSFQKHFISEKTWYNSKIMSDLQTKVFFLHKYVFVIRYRRQRMKGERYGSVGIIPHIAKDDCHRQVRDNQEHYELHPNIQ